MRLRRNRPGHFTNLSMASISSSYTTVSPAPGVVTFGRRGDNDGRGIMGAFGTTIRTGLHWLTAAVTLFAGFPVFQCRCAGTPTDPRPPVAAKTTACCCCGQGCAGPEADSAAAPRPVGERTCCCRHDGGRPSAPSRDAGGPRGKTCVQVAAKADDYLS